jgi:hypothetical protein
MIGIPAGIGIVLITFQSPVLPAQAAAGVFSPVRLRAATASLLDVSSSESSGAASRRTRGRRDMTIAGVVLAVSGTGMIIVNSAGLASGTTIPPGGERDGYLGKPGIVIGSALVITGIVLIVRAHAP